MITNSRARMRTPEAAAYCGLSTRTMEKLRLAGGGPRYFKIGRAVIYEREELDAWLERHRRRSTSDGGAAQERTCV